MRKVFIIGAILGVIPLWMAYNVLNPSKPPESPTVAHSTPAPTRAHTSLWEQWFPDHTPTLAPTPMKEVKSEPTATPEPTPRPTVTPIPEPTKDWGAYVDQKLREKGLIP